MSLIWFLGGVAIGYLGVQAIEAWYRRKLTGKAGSYRISQARAAAGRAQLDLAWELERACPGQHWYGNHADGQWCCHCGYDRDGKRIRTEPCEGARPTAREDA